MHEASAAEAIVKMVCGVAAERGESLGVAQRVASISLVVGVATGYMRESLEFYLAASAKGSPAEGAALDLVYVKPLLRCPSCGLEFERERFTLECPDCGAQGELTGKGSEFYVDSIELERAELASATEGRERAELAEPT